MFFLLFGVMMAQSDLYFPIVWLNHQIVYECVDPNQGRTPPDHLKQNADFFGFIIFQLGG